MLRLLVETIRIRVPSGIVEENLAWLG